MQTATPTARRSAAPRTHDLAFPGDVWVCPQSDIAIPKGSVRAHSAVRKKIWAQCENSEADRLTMWKWCKRDFVLWANLFVWTYKQKEIDAEGRQRSLWGRAARTPWITMPVHDALHYEIVGAIDGGYDLVVQKARDMLVSWHMVIEAVWWLLFRENSTPLFMSEVEEKVDGKSPGSLFRRMEYVIENLPYWMVPPGSIDRTFKHIGNRLNGSSIDGTSTTATASVGDRRTFIVPDEAALNPFLEEIWNSTRDVSDTRIPVSTHEGPGTFRDLCFSNAKVFTVGYWDHPEKGRGREWVQDDAAGTISKHPNRWFWNTPWFKREAAQRTKRDIAKNLLIDPDTSGNTVFPLHILISMRAEGAKHLPTFVGDIAHKYAYGERQDISLREGRFNDIRLERRRGGLLKFWGAMVDGRPDPHHNFVLTADVGIGNGASNSVIKIGDADLRTAVGIWASAAATPSQFARIMAMIGYWLNPEGAPLCWERNGAGEIVELEMLQIEYPNIICEDSGKHGWYSSASKKRALLEDLAAGFERGEVSTWDDDTLRECGEYVYTPTGVETSRLVADKDARSTHGDRVIAMGLNWWAMKRTEPRELRPKMVDPVFERVEAEYEEDSDYRF